MVKKSQCKLDVINKNGHSLFHTSKPGNFNSLREGIFILTQLPEADWRGESVSKKLCGYYSHAF